MKSAIAAHSTCFLSLKMVPLAHPLTVGANGRPVILSDVTTSRTPGYVHGYATVNGRKEWLMVPCTCLVPLSSVPPTGKASLVNRYGTRLIVGDCVRVTHARGGSDIDTIASFDRKGAFVRAYGVRVRLVSGLSCGVDDCSLVSTP